MKIKELSLKNFKSVVDQSFKFNDGIICFSGDNGEGKSTVIHAILILLFNSCEMSFKDYINWNASKFFISTVFEHDGNEYYEEFEYGEKSGSKRILKNLTTNELWENSSAISILSQIIDPDLAKASIVSMENEQNLITTTPAKRREYLKGLYNLEFKDQLSSITDDLQKISHDEIRCKAKIDALEEHTFEHKELIDKPYSEEEYEKAKNDIAVLNAKKGELELQKQKRDNIQLKLNEATLSVRRQTLQLSTIRDKLLSLENDLINAENDLKTKEAENRISEFNERLEKLKTAHEKDVRELASEINRYQNEIDELQSHPDMGEDIEKIRADIQESSLKQREIQVLILQSREKLKVLMTGKCPTCGHVVSQEETDNENKILGDLEQKNADIDSKLVMMRNLYSEKKNAYDKIVKDLDVAKKNHYAAKSNFDIENTTFDNTSMQIQHEIEMYQTNKQNAIDRFKANIENSKKMIESQKDIKAQTEELLGRYKESVTAFNEELDSIDDPMSAITDILRGIEGLNVVVESYEKTKQHNDWVVKYNEEQDLKAKKRDEEVLKLKNTLAQASIASIVSASTRRMKFFVSFFAMINGSAYQCLLRAEHFRHHRAQRAGC